MRINFSYLINSTLSEDIGIDLGSFMTSIYIQNKGIVLKEPSYIALDTRTNEVVSVGTQAYEMIGKNPPCIKIVQPIENGVISDIELAVKMLKAFISRVYKQTVLKPRVMACVPSDSTEIERHAIVGVLKDSGAREVYLIDAPLAAAVGAGCDISLARGLLIAHIGAGRCDVSSISLGRSVIGKSINVAGNTFTEEIIKHIKNAHNINIGTLTAEAVKKKIGCAYPLEKLTTMNISGCDVTSGLPRFISVSSEEIRECLLSSLLKIANIIKTTLKDTPPDLLADILEDGILITGGGGMLYGLDKYLRMELGIKVFVIDDMQDCAIKGIGAELSKLDLTKAQGGKFYYAVD